MGSTIRKAIAGEEKDVAHVIIQTWKTAYKGIIDNAFLDAMDENGEKRLSGIRQDIAKGKIYVASVDGKVVGIAIYGNARDDKYAGRGELYALYVLDEYQNMGIGRRLINAVKNDFCQNGYKNFIIACLSENPSCRFYEKMGGKKIDEKFCAIGGKNYKESIFDYIITIQ
jgi:GNAT superfamily N-acetyltransferase